ncbi:ribosome biogenesis factor YjgA [Xylophilus sp. GOD-11R]|uniref:ribosome biogenesis factor YjgA n=1 Tax=Xylophilus sp. GOD-11R TaxID=3089814 RepID=UPI00298C1D8A|nr:ribosome biogenesis factor YjgA [Xylophilus sp. GOD-11R]WPB59050.1 ribosome biogenesis factor YjgA [Xylophilus sp. GOD-11R]
MSRKPKKGYFVRGQFVAEGSELDLEMKAELKGTADATRTDLKRESTELQKLGEDLLTLRNEVRLALALPEKLEDALADARKITNFEGRRRQGQFIGKLMRKLDEEQVAAVRAALDAQQRGSAAEAAALHEAEAWRVALIDSDESVQDWISRFPQTDIQQLRALVRQARKDAVPEKPGAAPRHGRAYREIFQLVRATLLGDTPDDAPAEDDEDDRDD